MSKVVFIQQPASTRHFMIMISANNDPYTALNTVIQPAANGRHSATIILLHCLGDRADNFEQSIRYLLGRNLLERQPNLRHIRVLLPYSPRLKFTLFNGRPTNVWFDCYGTSTNIDIPEKRSGFTISDRLLGDLIDAEIAAGVPMERIVVAGYSLGGYMALRVGLLLRPGIGGICGMSTYLKYDNMVFDWLQTVDAGTIAALPPLLMFHGDKDDLLEYKWGRITFSELQRLGVCGEFRTIVGMRHEMRANELMELEQWLAERLPALPGDTVSKL